MDGQLTRAETWRVCAEPGCPTLVHKGYCPEHARKPWAGWQSPNRPHDASWYRFRRAYIRAHPFCEWPAGCNRPSEELDHIVPLAKGGAPREDSNLQALCRPHHAEKTAGERV